MTLIARVADALPLAASMQEDEQVKINRRDINAISVSGSSDLIDIFQEGTVIALHHIQLCIEKCSLTTDGHHKNKQKQQDTCYPKFNMFYGLTM